MNGRFYQTAPFPYCCLSVVAAFAVWLAGMGNCLGESDYGAAPIPYTTSKSASLGPRPVRIRPPLSAGTHYPEDPIRLFDMVGSMISSQQDVGCRGATAILAPHAGYGYSGMVAAAAFRQVDTEFRRVFILAAGHSSKVALEGVSLPAFTHYAIPSAEIPLSPVLEDLRRDPIFVSEPEVHTRHMTETMLPFLHYLRGRPAAADFTIIPMVLGRMDTAAAERLAEILQRYADHQTLFVFSVDLSHDYSEKKARRLDMHTIQSIMSLDRHALGRAETDGNQVLQTMVAMAKVNGWEPTYLAYQNSGNVTGDHDRVVGYGSIVFHQPFSLDQDQRAALLSMARSAIAAAVQGKAPQAPDTALVQSNPIFRLPRGVFVTLEKGGRLRGCIGELYPRGALHEAVRRCAVKSATQDPRFPPVDHRELDTLTVSVSVLGFPQRMETDATHALPTMLRPGEDGIVLVHKGRQSTFLPKVWEDIPEPVAFLSRLCLKQGSPSDCWQDSETILYRYGAYDFHEPTD